MPVLLHRTAFSSVTLSYLFSFPCLSWSHCQTPSHKHSLDSTASLNTTLWSSSSSLAGVMTWLWPSLRSLWNGRSALQPHLSVCLCEAMKCVLYGGLQSNCHRPLPYPSSTRQTIFCFTSSIIFTIPSFISFLSESNSPRVSVEITHETETGAWFSSSFYRVVCICQLARPEWARGAVEPITAMGFVCSKHSVAVVGVIGFKWDWATVTDVKGCCFWWLQWSLWTGGSAEPGPLEFVTDC